MKPRLAIIALVVVMTTAAGAWPSASHAASSAQAAGGVTAPAGLIWLPGSLGGHLWIADSFRGLCRLDPVQGPVVGGTLAVNAATCNTFAMSPGQPSFDPATNYVYLPDNSGRGLGVLRLSFDRSTETIGGASLITLGETRTGARPSTTAISPDGSVLYVGFAASGEILGVTNPSGPVSGQALVSIGRASNGLGTLSLAAIGADLYLAEATAITQIANAANCRGCIAASFGLIAFSPTAIAADGPYLYVANTTLADTSDVLRYSLAEGSTELYSTEGTTEAGTAAPYQNLSAIGFDPSGNIYLADDPQNGVQALYGRLWKIAVGALPGRPALSDRLGAADQVAKNLTAPAGLAWLGNDLWVSDQTRGFCRLDAEPASATQGTLAINPVTCDQTAVSPGQPSFDPVRNFVYVPDNSPASVGVVRLKFDPVTQSVSGPFILSDAADLAFGQPAATALGPDGNLYVGFLGSGEIVRITNPSGAVQTVQRVGQVTDWIFTNSLAFVGSELFIAERSAVTKISDPGQNCSAGDCVPSAVVKAPLEAPLSLAHGHDELFIGDIRSVYRLNLATLGLETLTSRGRTGDTIAGFQNSSALAFNNQTGDLYVGDDPALGFTSSRGRVWRTYTTYPYRLFLPAFFHNPGGE